MEHFVYVLYSPKKKLFYKGLTNNIDRRLSEHFSGKTNFSRNKLPIYLLHVETCNSILEARKLEKFFKSGYGREIIKEIYDEHAEMVEW